MLLPIFMGIIGIGGGIFLGKQLFPAEEPFDRLIYVGAAAQRVADQLKNMEIPYVAREGPTFSGQAIFIKKSDLDKHAAALGPIVSLVKQIKG